MWIACGRLGSRLFEQVEGDIVEIREGFFGLVDLCTSQQQHDFPFFEPNNSRRRIRVCAIRPGVGREGFVDTMINRWGLETLRQSRTASDNPHYFVPAIEGLIELLHWEPTGLPPGRFYVRARYDIDFEGELAAFVEPLLLPDSGPHDFIGDSW